MLHAHLSSEYRHSKAMLLDAWAVAGTKLSMTTTHNSSTTPHLNTFMRNAFESDRIVR